MALLHAWEIYMHSDLHVLAHIIYPFKVHYTYPMHTNTPFAFTLMAKFH